MCRFLRVVFASLAMFLVIGRTVARATPQGSAIAVASPVQPVGVSTSDLPIVTQNEIESPGPRNGVIVSSAGTLPPVTFDLINKIRDKLVNIFVTGQDEQGRHMMLQRNGSWFRLHNAPVNQSSLDLVTAPVAIPLGEYGSTTSIIIDRPVSSGRVYMAAGPLRFSVTHDTINGPRLVEPAFLDSADSNAKVLYGFAEFTRNAAELYADLSFIDWVGLPYGMKLTTSSGIPQLVTGLPSDATESICDNLDKQSALDGQEWSKLCIKNESGSSLRVLNPEHGVHKGYFANYWQEYVDKVYSYYANNDLTISGGGNTYVGRVNPRTSELEFDSEDSFAKPSSMDIFGCSSGPFANAGTPTRKNIIPVLCAAFNRGTFLLPGGNIQPQGVNASQYYSTSPNNHFSRIVHAHELDGRGYTFGYDDVNAPGSNADQSGKVEASDPTRLTITVGSPAS